MMRTDVLDTIYRTIERTDNAINDLLDHCCIKKRENLCVLSQHVDNLKDCICMLEKIGEEDIYFKLRGAFCSTPSMMKVAPEAVSDKPVIVKKSTSATNTF